MVYSLKVLQEVSRDSAQACCLGSCGSLDAHAVSKARTCTVMRTSALVDLRRSYVPPKGVHTCVAAAVSHAAAISTTIHEPGSTVVHVYSYAGFVCYYCCCCCCCRTMEIVQEGESNSVACRYNYSWYSTEKMPCVCFVFVFVFVRIPTGDF